MACSDDRVMELNDGDLAELRDVRGATLRVTRGTLWITQDRDVRDVVLRAGDVWMVERDGLTLVEAQEPAAFCIVGGDARRVSRDAPVATSAERLAAWFAWLPGLEDVRPGRQSVPYF